MANSSLLSISEKLLLAADDLERSGRRPFSAEDLVVAAWRKFRDTFGLAGYRGEDGRSLYPDSNRVFAEIMGMKPIRKRGLFVKVGKKMYQLTDAGREHTRFLVGRLGASPIEKSGLGREVQQELKRLFTAKATEKCRDGRLTNLTFRDACAFWGISSGSSALEFRRRMDHFKQVVDGAREAVQGKAVTFEHGGRTYSDRDLDDLLEVHRELLTRFHAEIEAIQERKDGGKR